MAAQLAAQRAQREAIQATVRQVSTSSVTKSNRLRLLLILLPAWDRVHASATLVGSASLMCMCA